MAKVKLNMTEGKILPLLWRFALPVMATSVIHQLFNTADSIVVGRWGGETALAREIALSAVGSSTHLCSLIIAIFAGLAVGAGVSVSHAVGAKEYDKISRIVHTAVTTAMLAGTVLAFLGFIFARPLLQLMSTPDTVLDQAVLYVRAYFCGVPALLIYNYCASILQATGDSTRPLIFLSIAGVVNVLLNLVMVMGFNQGALGVGVATAASHWMSCIMVLIYMAKGNDLFRFSFRRLALHGSILKKILAMGVPAGIQASMFEIGNVVMQSALNSFNNTVYVSGSSIGSNIGAYTQLIVAAFVSAAYVFVGQNTGAKNMERIRKCVRQSSFLVVALAVALNTVLNLCSAPLLAIYAPNNPAVVEFARTKLAINSSFYFLEHLLSLYASSMRGMGRSTAPMLISVGGICGVRLLWIYTVFAAIRNPLTIFFAYPVSWGLTFIAQFALYHSTRKKLERAWRLEKDEKESLAVEANA